MTDKFLKNISTKLATRDLLIRITGSGWFVSASRSPQSKQMSNSGLILEFLQIYPSLQVCEFSGLRSQTYFLLV